MNALPKKQNRWLHGRSRFEHPPLEYFFGMSDGLLPVKVMLDPDVGWEVVLYVRDQTPFIEELRLVQPFRLLFKAGVGRNEFGPLGFFVFWIPAPALPDKAFAAYDVYLNPKSESQLAKWRELAAQSHWHLFLIGAGNRQRGFFEFENNHHLDDALDFILEACDPIPLLDFDRAKEKFMQKYSLEDLRTMK